MALAHVSVHVVELEEGVRTVVEVGVVTGRDGIPPLGGSATRADLIPAVGEALDRHHIIQLEIVAGEGRHISGSGSSQVAFTLHGVVAKVTVNVKAGTAKARIGAVQRDHTSNGIQITVPSKEETTIQDGKRISIRIHKTHVSGRKGEFLTRAVCVRCSIHHGAAKAREEVTLHQLRQRFFGEYVQVVTSGIPCRVNRKED